MSPKRMRATASATDLLLRAAGDPVAELQPIAPGHPEFHRAQVIRAAAGVLAKVPDALPSIGAAIGPLDDPGVAAPLRAHGLAAEAWLAGDPLQAAARYAAIVRRWPHDLVALRLAQSCYFFVGDHVEASRVADAALGAVRPGRLGYGFVLAMAAFAHAEAGDGASAESLGRAALARDPACPMGVHAVAHAFAESGRHAAGAHRMREQRAQWACDSRMRTHNAWHLAMFDLDDGRLEPAIDILDSCLLPAADRWPLDACDATALAWRIELAGVPAAGRWQRLSDAFARIWRPGFWPYVDLHAALAHLAADRGSRFADLLGTIARIAGGRGHGARRARGVTLPFLRVMRGWSTGERIDRATGCAVLTAVLRGAGGSRLQLELFADVERENARRSQPVAVARPGAASACATWPAVLHTPA